MAQSAKHLLHKCEDQRLIPRATYKVGVVEWSCNPAAGEADRLIPGTGWFAS